jgi:hypothetical protein
MKRMHVVIALLLATFCLAQETPKTSVDTYESLADAILAVKRTEADFVRSLLDGYRHAAENAMKRGDVETAAAYVALFGNEGCNAVGGVRKRLLEGGHHHNAAGEAQGIFDPGYVIVTKETKAKALAASAALRKAGDDAARRKAWDDFAALAAKALAAE